MTTRTVAYCHDSHGFGGMELYMLELMERMSSTDYRPVLVVPGFRDEFRASPSELLAAAHDRGIPILRTPPSRGPAPLDTVEELVRTTRLFSRLEPSVVHIHTCRPEGARKVTLAARCAGVPAVVRTEHMPPEVFSDARTARRVRLFDHLTDAIVTGSHGDREAQLGLLGRSPSKVVCAYNSIDWRAFDPDHDVQAAKRSLGLDPTIPVLGTVGRLVRQKGQRHLIDALPWVLEQHGPVNVLVVGDGVLHDELVDHARLLGVEHAVHFVGHQADIRPYVHAMDVAVMPSLWEVLSLAMLEFMALGKPIVASDHSSFREGLGDGECGVLVRTGDSAELGQAIVALLRSPSTRRELGRRARERVERLYDIDRLVREMADLYDRLIDDDDDRRGLPRSMTGPPFRSRRVDVSSR